MNNEEEAPKTTFKRQASAQIQEHTERFLKNGGTIQQLDSSATAFKVYNTRSDVEKANSITAKNRIKYLTEEIK